MSTKTISFPDWVDWLAVEFTFGELYRSASPSHRRETTATMRRLADGLSDAEIEAFASRVPHVERALSRFSAEDRSHFAPRLATAVAELAQHLSPASAESK